ncbi:MAG: FkbM family methyltransferase [Verrucomicrobia bacterium]|nr:FkbM family methyltransferase [Verrucomicrobiota bacterium]
MPPRSPLPLGDLLEALSELPSAHPRATKAYRILDHLAATTAAASGFASTEPQAVSLGGFGELVFPYAQMGAIDTLDLFGLDELIIFAFYWANRRRYQRAADIGANLGLHSILMAKCGWAVRAFEPDPAHAAQLRRRLALNRVTSVEVVEAAVSDAPGTLEFVRVLGNTTSSHLAGAKPNPYGDLERFPVRVESIAAIMPTVDFLKTDAEGQEGAIVLGTTPELWDGTDMILEVGSVENARAIFTHTQRIGVRAFAQKLAWGQVAALDDMPTSYKDGSLFLSRRPAMPWS